MPERIVCAAETARSRLDRVRSLLRDRVEPGQTWWIVAPTRRAADAFVRETVDEAWIGVLRFGFEGWARAFAPPQLGPVASPLARLAVAARAASELRGAGGLTHFGPVAGYPGFARCLLETAIELRAFEVDASDLEATGPAGRDLAALVRQLRAVAREHRVSLPGEALAAAAPPDPGPAGLVLLDVSLETPLERAFVRRMAGSASTVLATTGDDPEPLAALLSARVETLEGPGEPGAAELRRLRRALFSSSDDPLGPPDGSVVIRSCRNEAAEAVEIARAALERADDGVLFDRMAVVLREPALHQPLLDDAFARAGVPAFFTQGARRPHPGGRALLALLACAEENLSASRFAEYLGFGQVPSAALALRPTPWVPAASTAPQLELPFEAPPSLADDPSADGSLQVPLRWEQWLVDAAVVGTEARWRRRLDGLAQEIRAQIEREADPTAREGLKGRLHSLVSLREFALPLVERLAALRAPRPWARWHSDLEALAMAALREPLAVLAILAELRPLASSTPVSLFEVRLTLERPLSTFRPEPAREPYGAVWVGTTDEVAGRSFDTVFLPGLSEGVFPSPFREDPLAPDPLRGALDPELVARPRHRTRERRAFRAALQAAERRVMLTSSRLQEARGRPQVPSQYLLEAARRAEGGLDALRALTRPASDRRAFGLGWEVPRSPERAIDDAEYDLAVARELAETDPAAAEGRAAYLRSSPTLLRALRRRSSRWRKAIGPADGGVIAEQRAAWRAENGDGLEGLVTSPTALRAFAACPYRFWLYGLLRLRDDTETLGPETLDPRTRGSIFHDVQFRYFARCQREGARPSEALELLDEVWAEAKVRWREEIAPAIDAVYDRELAQIRTDLRGWWRRVRERPDGFEPLHAELAFGLDGDPALRDPESSRDPVWIDGRFPVRGSIDLVEVDAQGRLRVTDYKTGRPPDRAPAAIGGGETLQPLVYARAAETLLGAPVVEGRLVYCTIRRDFRADVIPAVEAEALTEVLEVIDDHLRRGFFPAVPRDGACRYCDFRSVCGHREEERAERKDPEALVDLAASRSRP